MKPKLFLYFALVILFEDSSVARQQTHQSAGTEPVNPPVATIPRREPGASKIISSNSEMLAALIAQLQQPKTRFQAFLDLVAFAGDRKPGNIVALNGPDAIDDHELEQMDAQATKAIDGCPDLDGVIAEAMRQLGEPAHRLEMISALLKFAGPKFWTGSMIEISDNPKLDALKDKARDAANQEADVKTVTEALPNADPTLRTWSVQKFGNPLSRTDQWTPRLLPRIEEIASGGPDRDLRGAAIGSLRHFPGTEKFLDERVAREKSAFLLMNLLHGRDIWGKEFDRKFQDRLTELLSDPEESVRTEGLDFIGCSEGWADMYKVSFKRKIFEQVIAATKSQSAKERFEAIFALAYVKHLAPEASREALLRLVNDPDENVRWRLGFCLAGQYQRKEVKRVIATLISDKSPMVRYMTILAVGPKKYVPQLREIAHGPATPAAEWASEKLHQIGAAE